MNSVEQWRDVVGRENWYQVSDHGHVRSLDRVTVDRNGRRIRRRGQLLKASPDSYGRPVVKLGRGTFRFVHHLVLEAFIGPRPPDTECCHADDDPGNNWPYNLRWGTSSSNHYDMVRNGRHHGATRTQCIGEHGLFPPNLVAGTHESGRQCLACARARANQQYAQLMGRQFDLRAAADRHYRKIMQLPELGSDPSSLTAA